MRTKLIPWIGGAAILAVLFTMIELPSHLHGPTWAVLLAGACVYAVGVAVIWVLARWLDRHAARMRRGDGE